MKKLVRTLSGIVLLSAMHGTSGFAGLASDEIAALHDRVITEADLTGVTFSDDHVEQLAWVIEDLLMTKLSERFGIKTDSASIEGYLREFHPDMVSPTAMAEAQASKRVLLPALRRVAGGASPEVVYDDELAKVITLESWLSAAEQWSEPEMLSYIEELLTARPEELVAEQVAASERLYVWERIKLSICDQPQLKARIGTRLKTTGPLRFNQNEFPAGVRPQEAAYACEVAARKWLKDEVAANLVIHEAAYKGVEERLWFWQPVPFTEEWRERHPARDQ